MNNLDSSVVGRVLEFFNKVKDPGRIVDRIRDDAAYGKVGYGIRPSLARKIIAARDALLNRRFDTIHQIDSVPGVGPDTLHDILNAFKDEKSEPEFSFRVEIDGVIQDSFLEIEGLESVTRVVLSADGDNPIIRKTPGRPKYSDLVLRRELSNNDEIWKWRKQVIDGRIERKTISIIVLDASGDEVTRYHAFKAWPCYWGVSVLKTDGQESIIEEIIVAVEGIERVS